MSDDCLSVFIQAKNINAAVLEKYMESGWIERDENVEETLARDNKK